MGLDKFVEPNKQSFVWNEMKWKFWYGYRRCQNGMEYFNNGMEDNLSYFHTNSILDFVFWNLHKNIRIVINNILTAQKYPTSFVERYFGCVYNANSVGIASL